MANYGCTLRDAGSLPSAPTANYPATYANTLNRYTSVYSSFNNQSRATAYCGVSRPDSARVYARYEIAGRDGVLSTITGIALDQSGFAGGYVSRGLTTYMGLSKWDQGAYEGAVTVPVANFILPSDVTSITMEPRIDHSSGLLYIVREVRFTASGMYGFVLYRMSTYDPEQTYQPDYIYDIGSSAAPGIPIFMKILGQSNATFIYNYPGQGAVYAHYNNGTTVRKWIRFPITGHGVYFQLCTLFNSDGTYLYFQHYQTYQSATNPTHWYFVRVPVSVIPATAPSTTTLDIDDCDIAIHPAPPDVTARSIATVMMPYNGGVYIGKKGDTNTTSTTTIPIQYLSFATMPPEPPEPPEPSDDPYQEEGGISDYGGGGAGIDMTESDDIDFPTPPSNLIADCGLISFYNPSKQEIIDLADQIMSQSIAGAIKNIFTDPLEGIVSLALFNGSPPLSGSRGEIKVGLIGTGVTANLLSSSYMTLDCGSITVGDKTKGNALDFSPYTTAQLYLPYIGFASVSPDDFMYGTVHIKYNIDLLSGSCVAMVRIQKDGKNDLLYTYSGNVLTSIPLSGKNYKEIIKATATITAAVAVGGVAGGIATGAATGALSSAAKAGFVEYMDQFESAGVSAATKPSITRSGRLDMSIGAMSPKKPYLVFSRPAQSLPEKFKSYRGYPSNVTTKLSDLVGYTEVQDVHLTGIPATTEELDLIMEHLKGGIII